MTQAQPYDREAERATLAALLVDPKQAAPLATRLLKPGDFFVTPFGLIFAAIAALYEAGKDIDLVTVGHELRKAGSLDNVGGPAGLADLAAAAGSAANAAAHIEIVRACARKRELQHQLARYAEVLSNGAHPDKLHKHMAEVAEAAQAITPPDAGIIEYMTPDEIWGQEIDTPWVFHRRFARNDLVTIGAEYGTGKTWFAYAMALSVATGLPWLEEVPQRTGKVIYCDRENPRHLIQKRMKKLWRNSEPPADLKYLWYPPAQFDKAEGREFYRNLLDVERPALLIFDTLSKFHSKNENKAEEMTPVLEFVQGLCREFDTTIVLLHHYNKDDGTKNTRQRLRGSTSIGDNSDQIFALQATGKGIRMGHDKARHDAPFDAMICQIQDEADGSVHIAVTERNALTKREENANELYGWIREYQNKHTIGPLRTDIIAEFKDRKWGERRIEYSLADLTKQERIGRHNEKDGARYFTKAKD